MAKPRSYYEQLARDAAIRNNLDPDLFARQISAESGFNPNAISPAGARGIAQIMPATARGWNVNPMDPSAALDAAARNMSRYVRDYGGWRNALVAYNAGPGRVGKPLYSETRSYISKILGGDNPTGITRSVPQPAPVSNNMDAGLLSIIFSGSPLQDVMVELASGRGVQDSGGVQRTSKPVEAPSVAGIPFRKDWRWLQSVGQQVFGLRNDPGTSQTTGGRHSANSRHYRSLAIDFGDARNTRKQLNAFYNWALKNRKRYGFSEVLDEGDHIHVAF